MPAYDKIRIKIAAIIVGVLLLLLCPSARALDPSLDVSQYGHTAWLVREGFTQGFIRSIAQTPDGYIWLGTGFGLFRFDGVRVERWQPPSNGEQLPSNFVIRLQVARDGTLWIGTMNGLVSWKDGRLVRYPALAGLIVSSILEDHLGTVWVGAQSFLPPAKLCAIHRTNVDCDGLNGGLSTEVSGLYEDSHGVLWAVGADGIWRWRPGPPRFYHLPLGSSSVQDLGEAEGGTLLIPLPGRLARFGQGKLETQYPYPPPARNGTGIIVLRDRDGGIWVGTDNAGIVHLHNGRADVFTQADGLSDNLVTSLFEDREGNVWVATLGGLDRFHNYAVTTYAQREGLGTPPGWGSVVAARDGSIWMGTKDGLRRWNHGEVTIYGSAENHTSQSRSVSVPVRYVPNSGLRDDIFVSVLGDYAGRILLSTPNEFGYMEDGRFISVRGVAGGLVSSVAQDGKGSLWMVQQDALLRLSKDGTVQRTPWTSIGHKDSAQSLATDRSTSGLWLGFNDGGVAYFSGGQIERTYGHSDGLGSGRVNALDVDADDTVWAATESGLSRIKSGRVLTLTSKNGLPCDGIHWIMQDENHSFWIYLTCGLVRIERSELDGWTNDSRRKLKMTVFDSSDGVLNTPIAFHRGPHVTKSLDGRIWFEGFMGGVSVIDPKHFPDYRNKITPPVYIERITANGKTYEASNGLRLPPRIRDLKIDYTALSFVAPEKVQFRYQLEGQDRNWREVADDREVQYSNLPPGPYSFRVIARNNSDVWNDRGATLDFSIAPAYYQTIWFRLCCIAALLLLLWCAYLFRVWQLQEQFAASLETRIDERTRIARDLHDTLLQSFLALMFQFQAARNMVPRRPEDAVHALDEAINATSKAIAESREAISDLRPDPLAQGDIPELLKAAGLELSTTEGANGHRATFRVTVEGRPQMIPAHLQDEVHRIAREAIRNAFRHAGASRIEAEVHYDKDQLRLRVRDDGKGIDPKIVADGGRPGHWGIPGILERAKRIGSRLEFWTEEGAGTEVELVLPGAIAYGKARSGSRFRLFRRTSKNDQRS